MITELETYGKNSPKVGQTPAVALVNPKFPHNVGSAVRTIVRLTHLKE